jgi:hypothetical protein
LQVVDSKDLRRLAKRLVGRFWTLLIFGNVYSRLYGYLKYIFCTRS